MRLAPGDTMNRTFSATIVMSLCMCELATAQGTYQARVKSLNAPQPDVRFCRERLPDCVPTRCLPCFCLQSVYGTGDDPNLRAPSGSFKVMGLLSGKGIFTWENNCYSRVMHFAGEDANYWYYSAMYTPLYFAIAKAEDPKQKDHAMWIYDCRQTVGFRFYQYAAMYSCCITAYSQPSSETDYCPSNCSNHTGYSYGGYNMARPVYGCNY
jgi:hypothetical protein